LGKKVVLGVRVPEETREEIESLGFEVSPFVKQAIDNELRRKKAERALEWIKKNRVPGAEIGFDSAKILRRIRDTL